MKIHRTTRLLSLFGGAALLLLYLSPAARSAELSAQDRSFLAGYEQVHVALANDNLTAAKKAAAHLGSDGAALAKASSLDAARTEFAKLSDKAAPLTAGQPGYFVIHCPMANKDWVQTTEKVSNPYMGKDMTSCGIVKK